MTSDPDCRIARWISSSSTWSSRGRGQDTGQRWDPGHHCSWRENRCKHFTWARCPDPKPAACIATCFLLMPRSSWAPPESLVWRLCHSPARGLGPGMHAYGQWTREPGHSLLPEHSTFASVHCEIQKLLGSFLKQIRFNSKYMSFPRNTIY